MRSFWKRYRRNTGAVLGLAILGVVLIVALTWLDLRSRFSLARSEQQLAAFRDNMPAEMHMKSASGRYLMANPVFESVFNVPPGYALGKTDAELFAPDEVRERDTEHQQVIRSGRPFRRIYTRHCEDGSEATPGVGPPGSRSDKTVARFYRTDKDVARLQAPMCGRS